MHECYLRNTKESLIILMPRYTEIAVLIRDRNRETRAQKISASDAGDERSNYFQTFLISRSSSFGGRYKSFLLCAPVSYLNRVEYFRGGDPPEILTTTILTVTFPLKSISRINFTEQRGASRVIRRGGSSFCSWTLNIACPAVISNPRHPVTPCASPPRSPPPSPAFRSTTFCRPPPPPPPVA